MQPKKPKDLQAQRLKNELVRQQSLYNRVSKVQEDAKLQATMRGVDDEASFVQDTINEYMEVEVIRKSVKDVQRRAADEKKKRTMQGKAY